MRSSLYLKCHTKQSKTIPSWDFRFQINQSRFVFWWGFLLWRLMEGPQERLPWACSRGQNWTPGARLPTWSCSAWIRMSGSSAFVQCHLLISGKLEFGGHLRLEGTLEIRPSRTFIRYLRWLRLRALSQTLHRRFLVKVGWVVFSLSYSNTVVRRLLLMFVSISLMTSPKKWTGAVKF